MWNWAPTTIDTDGGGIGGGVDIFVSGLSECRSSGVCQATRMFEPNGLSECLSSSTCDLSSIGTRSGLSECRSGGTLDIGNGLTVRKGTTEVRNTNLIEFQGNLTFSGSYGKALLNILAGSGDAAVTYATRIDFVDSTTMYKGEAAVGSADGDVAWRISKYVFSADGDTSITWASGNDTFDKVWNNRASLSYS